ncbi:hypothetical protein FQN57_004309 [Myotisia sp. PD_48]|nr:hypothetical protein FQN57_004309 [Myotisia sp. PD_48]
MKNQDPKSISMESTEIVQMDKIPSLPARGDMFTRIYLSHANRNIDDFVARGKVHQVSRKKIEMQVLEGIDNSPFPTMYRIVFYSMVLYTNAFDVYWLGQQDKFRLSDVSITRLRPDLSLLQNLTSADMVQAIMDSSRASPAVNIDSESISESLAEDAENLAANDEINEPVAQNQESDSDSTDSTNDTEEDKEEIDINALPNIGSGEPPEHPSPVKIGRQMKGLKAPRQRYPTPNPTPVDIVGTPGCFTDTLGSFPEVPLMELYLARESEPTILKSVECENNHSVQAPTETRPEDAKAKKPRGGETAKKRSSGVKKKSTTRGNVSGRGRAGGRAGTSTRGKAIKSTGGKGKGKSI